MIKTEHNNKAIVKFEGNEIRKLTVNDNDYFIAKDVFDEKVCKQTRSFKDVMNCI